jgi:hypothetical protein
MHCHGGLSVNGTCFCAPSRCGVACLEPCPLQQLFACNVLLLFAVYVAYVMAHELSRT